LNKKFYSEEGHILGRKVLTCIM